MKQRTMVLVGSFNLLIAAAAVAQESSDARAARLFEEGRESFVAGNLVDACPKLAESYRLDPATGTLMALALCHEQEGKLALAWAELNEAEARARQEGRSDRIEYVRSRMDVLRARGYPPQAKSEPAPAQAPAFAPADPARDSGSAPSESGSGPSEAALMQNRIGLYLILGVGGEDETDLEGAGGKFESDMLATLGFGGHFELPLHRYFAVGGGPALSWINNEDDDDNDIGRSLLLDTSGFAKARYPFGSAGTQAEIYAKLPLGLSYMFVNSDVGEAVGAQVGSSETETSNGFGFNVGFAAGVQAMFDNGFGLFGQIGWAYHSLSFAFETPGFEDVDVEYSFGQLTLQAGGVIGL
jgi:hypothetical protein